MNPTEEAKSVLSRIQAAVELLRSLPGAHLEVHPEFEVMEELARMMNRTPLECDPHWSKEAGRAEQTVFLLAGFDGVRVTVLASRPVRVEPLPFSTETAP